MSKYDLIQLSNLPGSHQEQGHPWADPDQTLISRVIRRSQTKMPKIMCMLFSALREQIWQYQLQQRVTDWQFGQVALLSGTRFEVIIEGASYNGGFTLDDFKLYDGACASKYGFLHLSRSLHQFYIYIYH